MVLDMNQMKCCSGKLSSCFACLILRESQTIVSLKRHVKGNLRRIFLFFCRVFQGDVRSLAGEYELEVITYLNPIRYARYKINAAGVSTR